MKLERDDWRLDVTGADAAEVESVARSITIALAKSDARPLSRSPWLSGSFYLVTLIAIATTLLAIAKLLSVWAIPVVIVASLLAVTTIGAFQLRHDGTLSEKNFLQLMLAVLRQFPLLRKIAESQTQRRNDLR